MADHEFTITDEMGRADDTEAPPPAPDELEDLSLDTSTIVEGETAEADVFVVFGKYVEVPEADGTMVTIERPYDAPRYVSAIQPGERGNLLVAAGSEIPAEVVARLNA